MTFAGWGMILLFTALTLTLAKPAGDWMYMLYARDSLPGERALFKLMGADPRAEQSWVRYAVSLMAFNLFGIAFLFAVLKLQGVLPLNPQGFPAVETLLALNTAVSFVTNTNWQNYGGESTLSHLSQMLGLTVQNFLSAATGIAVAFAIIRGFARRQSAGIGNFWVDLTRVTLYLLLPASIVLALVYVALGVPQTFGRVGNRVDSGGRRTG